MDKNKIPGLALAVIRDNRVIKERAYGFASLELGVPLTVDTPFVLASMTKIFTASAIMLLVQEGRITLDEPVVKVLPQLLESKRLRNFLVNRSRNERLVAIIKGLADARGVTPAQMALAWIHDRAKVCGLTVVPIPGTRNAARLDENVRALAIHLTEAERATLEHLAVQGSGIRQSIN